MSNLHFKGHPPTTKNEGRLATRGNPPSPLDENSEKGNIKKSEPNRRNILKVLRSFLS